MRFTTHNLPERPLHALQYYSLQHFPSRPTQYLWSHDLQRVAPPTAAGGHVLPLGSPVVQQNRTLLLTFHSHLREGVSNYEIITFQIRTKFSPTGSTPRFLNHEYRSHTVPCIVACFQAWQTLKYYYNEKATVKSFLASTWIKCVHIL